MDLSEMSPTKSLKMSPISPKLGSPKKDIKSFKLEPGSFEGFPESKDIDFSSDEGTFSKARKSVFDRTRVEVTTPGSPSRNRRSRPSVAASPRMNDSSKLDRSNSIKSPVKKRLVGSVFSHRGSTESHHPTGSPSIKPGGMSFVALVALARKMGLVKKNHAYEDYMTKDQFNMIKDYSTGRFDHKEEKRTEQMERLKIKLLLSADQKQRIQRKKTTLFDWRDNLIPSMKRMYSRVKENMSKVIPPNGNLRFAWDMFTMILIFYDLVMMPLTISFEMVVPPAIKIWEMIVVACFILDIFMNFDTGFYDKGMLVMDRKRIITHYLTGWFLIDCFVSFPFEYIAPDDSESGISPTGNSFTILRIFHFGKYMKMFRFVRALKLKQLFVKLESHIDLSATMTSVIGFLKLSLITMYIAHWFGCIWHLVSAIELEDHPESWLTRHGVVDDIWVERYVASIYWSTTTMITVGYGDIVPITRNEKLLAISAMLVASAIFAYTMNRINVILDGLETTSEQYQKALATITGYMRKKHVKKELQIKIKKYLEYALEVETSLDSNEDCLNAYLNQSLKNELLLEIHGKILLENPIFKRFDNSLILKASLILKEKIFSPEDPVFLEGHSDDSSIYIIHSGRVEIFNFKSNSFLKTLTKGSYFGEISFFTGQARSASVRSTDFSALYLIRRAEFLDILKEFPLEREKFHEVKDRLSIYQDQTALSLFCYSCGGEDHLVNECPKVHAVIPKAKFIQTYLTRRKRFMNSYIRSGSRSDKRPDRYNQMTIAAKQIQVLVMEGEFQMDKALLYVTSHVELPDFNEHPENLLERRSRKVPTFTQNDLLFTRQKSSPENKEKKTKFPGTLSTLELESGSGTQETNSKLDGKKKLNSAISITPGSNGGKKKKDTENDVDKIENFKYYFPHNNFMTIFPGMFKRRKTEFDYFSQLDTTKDTLKRFISILKERVRQRRESLAKEKDAKRRSSFFRMGFGAVRSRFYKERPSVVESPTKSPMRLEAPKIEENDFRSDKSENNSSGSDLESP